MTFVVDGTNGLTFNDATTQASTATNASNISSGTLGKARLPTGSVLQVVNATYSTSTSVNNATLVDTGLTATITPSSSTSKILVLVNQNGNVGNNNTGDVGMRVALLRGASQIALIDGVLAYSGTPASGAYVGPIGVGSASICYLDSPTTTSATTYKTQFANRSSGSTGAVTTQNTSSTSTITLMEIAA